MKYIHMEHIRKRFDGAMLGRMGLAYIYDIRFEALDVRLTCDREPFVRYALYIELSY